LLDVLEAFRVARPRGIRVRQLVHDDERGAPCEDGVQIHLLERLLVILETATRDDVEAVKERTRFRSSMRLDDGDDDVRALPELLARRLEHRVRLADSRRHADEDLEPASLLPRRPLEERL